MKVPCVLLFSLVFASPAGAQTPPPQVFDPVTSREFLKQLVEDGVYNFISSKVAEGLVIHRVDPVLPHGDMMPRVSGTVIIAFEITKDGKVRRAMAVSGPKLLQAPVLAAVRQWTFKPYPLHGEPATVATTFQFNKPIAFRNRMEQVSRSGICCSRRFKLKSSETHSKAHLTLRKSEAGRIC